MLLNRSLILACLVMVSLSDSMADLSRLSGVPGCEWQEVSHCELCLRHVYMTKQARARSVHACTSGWMQVALAMTHMTAGLPDCARILPARMLAHMYTKKLCTHTHTHVHTYAYMHACIHTCIRLHTHTCIHIHTFMNARVQLHTYRHAYLHISICRFLLIRLVYTGHHCFD